MPSSTPRRDDWRGLVPQTPLQRSAYLNACTQWLVREPDASRGTATVLAHRTVSLAGTSGGVVEGDAGTSIFSLTELARIQRKVCLLCGSEADLRVVIANPFVIRSTVAVCQACGSR